MSHDPLRRLMLIRRFEERLIEVAAGGVVPGHFHVCIGQEATAVATTDCLAPDDVIYTTHRSHGHLLARGADPGRLMAEILGRVDGYCGGQGGTLHLAAAELNVPVTSAAIGGSLPMAVGAALTLSRKCPGAVVTCFFGDATFEEGALYEALNIAQLWTLPVLFLCENNGTEDPEQSGTFVWSSHAAERLTDLSAAFSIPSVQLNGIELDAQRESIRAIVEEIRAGGGPRLIETSSVRWPGNRTLWPSMPAGRTDVEWLIDPTGAPHMLRRWTEVADPLRLAYAAAEQASAIDARTLRSLDQEVTAQVEAGAQFALDSPFPVPTEEWFAQQALGADR